MRTRFPLSVAPLFAVALVSCADPAAVVDPGLQLAWLAPPPDMLREGDSARVAAQVTDRNGNRVVEFDGTTVSVRLTVPGDSQPATACGEACTATVADGQAALTVGWISAGAWTATACLDRPDGAEDLCAERALTVEPVVPVLVVYPADSVGRRERFAVEARLRLPDGTAVTDLAPAVRLRFGEDLGGDVRCPEAGPWCERAPVSGAVRLDSVSILDTATATLVACAVAPNGHERCDPSGPRAFRVVVPRATLRFVSQPADGLAGVPFSTQPVVEIVEPDGTRRTEFNDSVFIELEGDGARWVLFGEVPGVGTVRDRVPTMAALGVATFAGARVNHAGLYRLVADAPGAAPGTSADFSVSLDPAQLQLVRAQGNGQTAPPGTPLPILPIARVLGPANDPIAGIPVRFTIESGGGIVEAEWDTTNLDGFADPGPWMLGPAAGPQSLAAAAAGFPTVVFDAVAEVIPFERLAFVAPPPATLVAGDTMPPVVIELQDGQGRRVPGGTDSVRVLLGGGATFSGPVRVAVDGRVTFEGLTDTRATTLDLIAWDPRFAILDPGDKLIRATVAVTPRFQSPVLNFVSGGATATANTALDPVPTVSLSDIYGNPLPGRPVTFATTMGGGVVIDPTQTTSILGAASPGAWILGPLPGFNALTASAEGQQVTHFAAGLEPTFNLTGVATGGDFTCGPMLGTNQPYCWGANARSQLGEGTQTARSRPTPQAGALLPMTRMTAGWDFACGIAQANGAAYCWGYNLYGPLGIGAPDLNFHATPEAVHGGHVFQQISAGFYHVCALDTAGVVWCWGGGESGQLGVGIDRTGQYEPLQVISTARFIQIVVGLLHSCALADNGEVWCWGLNDYGQVGANDSLSSIYWIPQRVSGGRAFTEISAGGLSTCGISLGSVYCWGRNVEGQGGQGSTEATYLLEPIPALGILGTARHITVGTRHACATNGIDLMYCWGDNNRGQLGDGTTTQRLSAVEVTGGVNRFVAIDAGHEHTCALRDGGGAYCWGYNASGRLGLGFMSNTHVTAPTQVVHP